MVNSSRCGRLTLAASLLVACSKPPPTTTEAPGSSATAARTTVPLPAMKESAITPADKLGTLAEGTGVPVGSAAPEVSATDLNGQRVTLSALFEKGAVLITFYRGGWCPFCNFEIHALSKALPDFQARGVTPVAVSVDSPENAGKTASAIAIPFPVLADSELSFHSGFRVQKHVDDLERARLKAFGLDLEAASGRVHHVIGVPSLFLIDRRGVVRWAHSDIEYKTRPSVPQILGAIDAAKLER